MHYVCASADLVSRAFYSSQHSGGVAILETQEIKSVKKINPKNLIEYYTIFEID